MRILRLRLHNLNSLSGKWELDFTDPSFVSNGIFAITGPTGSGKTTILDAVCLALYGSTPRLGKVTGSNNEIMSRRCGECSAEVEFATVRGRYRCFWFQHRSRKKTDGNLQPPKREFSEVKTGKILASKSDEVARLVEEYTGMDFDRFTRSMLLAQGGFAAFLQAGQDDRAPILEQITGSGVYSEISKRVHVRFTAEKAAQTTLEEKVAAMQLLSLSREKELQQDVARLQTAQAESERTIRNNEALLVQLEKIAELQQDITVISKEQSSLLQEEKNFAEDAERLALAEQARVLEGEYTELRLLRDSQQKNIAALAAARLSLPKKETAVKEAEQHLNSSKDALEESRAAQEKGTAIIREVRELDLRINDTTATLDRDRKKQTALKEQQQQDQEQYTQLEQQKNKAAARLQKINRYLSEHRIDEQLNTELAALCLRLEQFGSSADTLKNLHLKRDKADKERGKTEQTWQKQQQAYLTAEKLLNDIGQQRVAIQDEQTALLNGRSIAEIRRDLRLLTDQCALLRQLLENARKQEKFVQDLRGFLSQQEELTAERDKQADEFALLQEEQKRTKEQAEALRIQVALCARIRDLEEERARLQAEHPCPLCGSLEHPYAEEENIPMLDAAEEKLQAALAAKDAADKKISDARVRRAQLEAKEQEMSRQLREKEDAVQELGEQQHTLYRELAGQTPVERNPVAIQQHLAAFQDRLAETQKQLDAAEQAEQKLDKFSHALDKQKDAVFQADRKQEAARNAREKAEQELQRLEQESKEAEEMLAAKQCIALEKLAVYSITGLSVNNPEKIITELTARRDQWLDKKKKKEAAVQKIASLDTAGRELQVAMDTRQSQMEEMEAALTDKRREQQNLVEQRVQLFAEKDPDLIEKQLAQAVKQAETDLQKSRKKYNQLLTDRALARADLRTQEDDVTKVRKEREQVEALFIQRLQEKSFTDEKAWCAARLAEEQRIALKKQADALRDRKIRLDTHLHSKETELAAAQEALSADDIQQEKLQQEQDALTNEQNHILQEIGSLQHQLQQNKEQRNQQQELLHSLEAQKRECLRWKELHDLIGSADGKKYRNFAQGLTFELMVARANEQLARMTDRYLLVRDQAQPLELNVIDSWQAGEIRSTKNLSGGESFVVSLALALGLSEMVGGNVRVDSLFLDEGFGALDDDALETALETLAGLQREGKLIGVISHVAALKERIACQLEVIPGTGGQSVVQGAGVRRVE
ncbi:MAG: AAA family ATPase [Candidatus Electrothrix sp. YB6]